MLNHQACEDIIALVRGFVSDTKNAAEAYDELPEVIDRETAVIRSRDVDAMEEVVREKLKVGQNLENLVSIMMEKSLKVLDLADRFGVPHSKYTLSVTGAVSLFREINSSVAEVDSFKSSVLEQLIRHAENAGEDFVKRVQETTRQIEVNKLVTAKLLQAYQESIRFWENVATEYEATYTDKGVRKTDPNHGVIKVGA